MDRGVRALLVATCCLAACTGNGSAHPATSAPAVTTVVATSDPSTSTSTTTTTTSTSTTTVPVPTTVSIEDLKAQIAADYKRAYFRRFELFAAPSLDNLDANVAEVAVEGSPVFEVFTRRISDLIAAGDRLVPNDPDILTITIEKVELLGDAPYTEGVVTSCQVDNRKQVTAAANSPVSVEVVVEGTGNLVAFRVADPVKLTAHGWLPYSDQLDGTQYEGQDTCPAP